MAGSISLSKRDINVLGKIRDPESNPASALRLDLSLPKDPYIVEPHEYSLVSEKERHLILVLQQVEIELAGLKPKTLADPIETYRKCVADLGELIVEYPRYASARNNRAQALRRLYGDDMLLECRKHHGANGHGDGSTGSPGDPLLGAAAAEEERAEAAATTLSDLDQAIVLLMPSSPFAPVLSPTAARTLSLAFTQRAAIYYATSRHMEPDRRRNGHIDRLEARWTKLDFEEAASRDFAMGGRFGNEIARGLAVGTNPTAKLCGQMVQQMMKIEYGSKD